MSENNNQETPNQEAAPKGKGPSKAFINTLVAVIVIFVLLILGLQWYNSYNAAPGSSVEVVEVDEVVENAVPAP